MDARSDAAKVAKMITGALSEHTHYLDGLHRIKAEGDLAWFDFRPRSTVRAGRCPCTHHPTAENR
jgi:hypothetical protein